MLKMKYHKSEAKEYAKHNIKGVWGASLTPFAPEYKIDAEGFRHNLRHCIDNLQIEGMFLNGLMGAAFHQTIAEPNLLFETTGKEPQGKTVDMPYRAYLVLENVLGRSNSAGETG